MDLDEPVDEDGPHLGVDLGLCGQVGWVHLVLALQRKKTPLMEPF